MSSDAGRGEEWVAGFVEACRRLGIKATHQRREIYGELAATEEHPDAETVYERVRSRIPSISLDTVYRTLRLFEEEGLIARVGPGGNRARFDANTERHHHFVCKGCGRIGDVYSKALDSFSPPTAALEIGTVDSVHVEFRGFCKSCRSKRRRKG
jgi:Fur family peroxide stress response transcriptional regulator